MAAILTGLALSSWTFGGNAHASGFWIQTGRLSGIVCALMMFAAILTMIRIPLLEKGWGHCALLRAHQPIVAAFVGTLVLHALAVTLGMAQQSGIRFTAQMASFFPIYPGMPGAILATGALLLTLVVSWKPIWKHLRYEVWHGLHVAVYFLVIVATVHIVLSGSQFQSTSLINVFWILLAATTLGLALWLRIVRPQRLTRTHRVSVTEVEPDGSQGVRVRMTGEDLKSLEPQPGQFFWFRFHSLSGWGSKNPFSLSAPVVDDQLEISVRVVGDGTRTIAALCEGSPVKIDGPYGEMTGERRQCDRLLMIGAGAGVAPLMSILQGEKYAPGNAVLVVRDRSAEERMCLDAIRTEEQQKGLVHLPLVGSRSPAGSTWLTAAEGTDGAKFLSKTAPDLGKRNGWDVFVCGPKKWCRSVLKDLRAAGTPRSQVHVEGF